MDSLPSWARVGVEVVCVDDYPYPIKDTDGIFRSPQTWNMRLPVKGEIYTISGFSNGGVYLKELSVGYIMPSTGKELSFKVSRFKPLIRKTIEEDIAIFLPLLKTVKEEEFV